jgi:NTP pyrophosphatase (non-canonical NTP hydrolase)
MSEPSVRVTIVDADQPDLVGKSWVTTESGEHIVDEPVQLTFDLLRQTNVTRCNHWHNGFPDNDDGWGSSDWSNAMQGEMGELAEVFARLVAHSGQVGNLVKKTRRIDHRLIGNRGADQDITVGELLDKLGTEAADVVIYLDLLMAYFRRDLGQAVAKKFNRVSDELDLPYQLPVT